MIMTAAFDCAGNDFDLFSKPEESESSWLLIDH
jgi:hypothetical protein